MGIDIGSALQIGSTLLGGISTMKHQTALYKAKIRQAVRSANFDFQGLNMQRRDLYEAAVEELSKVRMNQQSLASSVQAAIHENMEGGGRTADLLERQLQGDEARATSSIKNNLQKQNQELNYNMELTELNMKNQVNSLERPNNWKTLIGSWSQAFQQYQGVRQREHELGLQGWDTDPWGKVVKQPRELFTGALPTKDWLGVNNSGVADYAFSNPLDSYGAAAPYDQYAFNHGRWW